MSDPDFHRIEALFNAAMLHPGPGRAAFVAAAPEPAHIRDAVTRLLEHERAEHDAPLEPRLLALGAARAPAMPERIGPYRLIRAIGEGGMSTVFLAERDLPGAQRRVALKLANGVPTDAVRRRAAHERRLLAGLNHPHIAGLIDGGECADGLPYLAMDYIEGATLSEYLAAQTPPLAERVRLLLRCCEAVQHAHQRLILHRDIKPSNIIVCADGTPVLVDFGVGALLDGDPTHPRTTTLAFTPGYAAPEQLRGETATTATDVFGLGALLFDALSDTRLSRLRQGDAPVPAPSAHAGDAARRRAVRGDLDRIVAKATASAPEQRYLTAAALADDLQRYLRGEPVSAAPDAWAYRIAKFAGRHRWAVAAAVAALALGSVFVWRLDSERNRALQAEAAAEREAVSAKASRDFLVSVLGSAAPDAVRGQPLTVASLVSAAAAKLRAERFDDAATHAAAWLTVTEIYANLNDPNNALEAAAQADAALSRQRTGDSEMRLRILELRGAMLGELGRHEEAMRAMQAMLDMRARLGGDALARARAHRAFAAAATQAADFVRADRQLQRALTLLGPAQAGARGRLRLELLLDAVELHWQQFQPAAADRELAQLQPLATRLLDADDALWRRVHRAVSGVRLDQSRHAEALRHAELALAIAHRLYGARSRHTADEESETATVLAHMGRNREAIAHLERARAIAEELETGEESLASININLADYYARQGDYPRAIDLLDAALSKLSAQVPAHEAWRLAAYSQRGMAYAQSGRFPQAWPDLDVALNLSRARGEQSAEYAKTQARRALALLLAGRIDESARTLDIAQRLHLRLGIGPGTAMGAQLAEVEARVAQARGEAASATRLIERALAVAQRHADAISAPQRAQLQTTAAQIAWSRNDPERASALLTPAIAVLERDMAPHAPQLLRARQLAAQIAGRAPAGSAKRGTGARASR